MKLIILRDANDVPKHIPTYMENEFSFRSVGSDYIRNNKLNVLSDKTVNLLGFIKAQKIQDKYFISIPNIDENVNELDYKIIIDLLYKSNFYWVYISVKSEKFIETLNSTGNLKIIFKNPKFHWETVKNLTNENFDILFEDSTSYFPKSGKIAYIDEFGNIKGLPNPQNGIVYLISHEVINALIANGNFRDDVYTHGKTEKTNHIGTKIGYFNLLGFY